MFRKIYNQASITGFLVPDGPVLVVEGRESTDPTAPSLAFVRTRRTGGETVYLPGSSLKGVLRSHSERLLATELSEDAAEDPFDFQSPGRRLAHAARGKGDTAEVYRVSCAADRLFGSTEIAGRFRVADALPPDDETVPTETRFGVAIDRAKQAVLHGPFDQEVVTSGRFQFEATLENFDLWMLALVLQGLRDLNFGLVKVGHGTSRGFGVLRLPAPSLEIRWVGRAPRGIEGAGAREPDSVVRERYSLSHDDVVAFPADVSVQDQGFHSTVKLKDWEAISSLQDRLRSTRWEALSKSEAERTTMVEELTSQAHSGEEDTTHGL